MIAGPAPNTATSPFAAAWREESAVWKDYLRRHCPGAELLKSGYRRRVYAVDGRVRKIGRGETNAAVLTREFDLLRRADGCGLQLAPTLTRHSDGFTVLEMERRLGSHLSVLLRERSPIRLPLLAVIGRLAKLSWRGVVYRQLRPRHILVEGDGKFAFIDFGNSEITSPARAFLINFRPLGVGAGGGRLVALISQVLRHRAAALAGTWIAPGLSMRGFMVELSRRLLGQGARPPRPGSAAPPTAPPHDRAIRNLTRTREAAAGLRDCGHWGVHLAGALAALERAIRQPGVSSDIRGAHVGEFKLFGRNDLNFLWAKISESIDVSGRRVLDWHSGTGLSAIFAKLDGAASVLAADPSADLRDCAAGFAAAFGADGVSFASPDLDAAARFAPDIALFLSHRPNDPWPVIDRLEGCRAIVMETDGEVDECARQLDRRGFQITRTIANWNEATFVLCALRDPGAASRLTGLDAP